VMVGPWHGAEQCVLFCTPAGTSWTMLLAGSWSWTVGLAFPLRATTVSALGLGLLPAACWAQHAIKKLCLCLLNMLLGAQVGGIGLHRSGRTLLLLCPAGEWLTAKEKRLSTEAKTQAHLQKVGGRTRSWHPQCWA